MSFDDTLQFLSAELMVSVTGYIRSNLIMNKKIVVNGEYIVKSLEQIFTEILLRLHRLKHVLFRNISQTQKAMK